MTARKAATWYVGVGVRWVFTTIVLLLALIGFLQLTRGTAVRHVRGVGAHETPISPAEPQFPLSIALLTGAALSGGNRVEIALNGNGTFPRLWDDLRSATRYITIQMYYGLPGRVADTLREVLVERAAAGVHVLVLYDAFGTPHVSKKDRAAYRAMGIQLVPFRPLRLSTLHLLQNRSHLRGIVIDGRVGWTGGFGIDDKWLGDGHTDTAWRETNVRFEGPAVGQLQAAFVAAWAEATGELFSGPPTPLRSEPGGVMAGLLYTSPTLGSTPAERFVAASIAGARERLYITNAYFSPDPTFIALLADAARRGVDVRLLLAGHRTDVRMSRTAGRAQYAPLLDAGVRIYEWQPSTLHAKTFVVDGVWSSIGSMNFDNRSLALNDEATLMILDPAIGRRMEGIFLDDLHQAREITTAQFAQRSWTERLAELAARLLSRVI